jgi:hypothetical protein
MKMKRYCLVLVVFSILFTGCEKPEPETVPVPVSPTLSVNSVSVVEEESAEVTVSGGKTPYTATVSPTGTVMATVNVVKLIITGVKAGNATVTVAGSDGGKVSLSVTVTAKPVDPYAAFKADATPRWETVGEGTVKNDDSRFTFISDAGTLLGSTQRKWGYASHDGSVFTLIEWGVSPLIRREIGVIEITSFQSLKQEGGKEWLVFTLGAEEHRVVAE